MAFPSVVARTTLVSPTSNSSTWDTSGAVLGGSVGNLLIAIITSDGQPTLSAATNAPFGADWTKLGQETSGTAATGAVFYKIAEATTWGAAADALTINSTASEQYSGAFLRISGSNLQVEGASSNGASADSDPPNLSLAGGVAKDALWIAGRCGDRLVNASAAPSSYANLQNAAGGGANGASTDSAERSLNASSENPGAFTSASEDWVCWTLAVYEGSPNYVYKGSAGWSARYKGLRSDAALYKGAKVLHA